MAESGAINAAHGAETVAAPTVLGESCRAIHTNGAGTLSVKFVNDSTAVSLNVIDGAYYPYQIQEIVSLGTVTSVICLK